MKLWRAYFIESANDLKKVLASYEQATDKKPVVLQVSARAPDWLRKLVEETGMEIHTTSTLLPYDVWLTHETDRTQKEAI